MRQRIRLLYYLLFIVVISTCVFIVYKTIVYKTNERQIDISNNPFYNQPISSVDGYCIAILNSNEVCIYDEMVNNGIPQTIEGLKNIVSVSTSGRYPDGHSLALDKNGNIYAWGSNENNMLGIYADIIDYIYTPQIIKDLHNIVQVVVTDEMSIALDQNGNVWVWGLCLDKKKKLDINNVKKIDAVGTRIEALKNDGTIWDIDIPILIKTVGYMPSYAFASPSQMYIPDKIDITKPIVPKINSSINSVTDFDCRSGVYFTNKNFYWQYSMHNGYKKENSGDIKMFSNGYAMLNDGDVYYLLNDNEKIENLSNAKFINNNFVLGWDGWVYLITDNNLRCPYYANKLFSINKQYPYFNANHTIVSDFSKESTSLNNIGKKVITSSDIEKESTSLNNIGKKVITSSDIKIETLSQYVFVDNFHEGLSRVCKLVNGKRSWGFINRDFNEVIRCSYDYVGNFSEGLAYVMKDKKVFYINSQNEIILTPECNYANDFLNGYAVIKQSVNNSIDTKSGMIDKSGKVVVPIIYQDIYNFSEGLCAVELNNKWGFINNKNEMVIQCKYYLPYEYGDESKNSSFACPKFINGVTRVVIDNLFVLIDKTGKEVAKYTFIGEFNEGLAPVYSSANNSWGYIDYSGKEVIKTKYSNVTSFKHGVAAVTYSSLSNVSIIDEGGKAILNTPYKYATPLNNGDISFYDGKATGLMDIDGNIIMPPKFHTIGDFYNGIAQAFTGNEYEYINEKGQKIIDRSFDNHEDITMSICDGMDSMNYNFNDGIARFQIGNKNGLYNTYGFLIVK